MLPLRLRFPQSARLSRASEFARLRRDGQSFHGKLIVLSVLKIEPEAETRIGLITSRRVGGAVVRNRVLRPQFRRGLHLVIVARAAAAKAEFALLRADVLFLAQRSAILVPACS